MLWDFKKPSKASVLAFIDGPLISWDFFMTSLEIFEKLIIILFGVENADKVMSKLKIPMCTASMGGVETLITRPVLTSHSLLSDEELLESGIDKSLIRLAVGIESAEDLINDLDQALS